MPPEALRLKLSKELMVLRLSQESNQKQTCWNPIFNGEVFSKNTSGAFSRTRPGTSPPSAELLTSGDVIAGERGR